MQSPATGDTLRARALLAAGDILSMAAMAGYAGFDPYDGLAARLWPASLLKRSRAGRLALIQCVRRSPLDLRPLLRVPALVNPKTLGLLMSTCCDLFAVTGDSRYRVQYLQMAAAARTMALPGWSGACWGYPFDWQARAFYLPAGTPTVVCTAFVARGYLDGYRTFGRQEDLDTVRGAAAFILNDLNRSPGDQGFAFSYSPLDHKVVHNASALGAWLLADAGSVFDDGPPLQASREAFRHLLACQRPDGTWPYGLAGHHQWIDALHTGYVLEALAGAGDRLHDSSLRAAFERGHEAYAGRLVAADGLPRERAGDEGRHFEAHTLAEAVILTARHGHPGVDAQQHLARLVEFGLNSRAPSGAFPDAWRDRRAVLRVRGGFLRWTQAWMARALAAALPRLP